MWLTIHFVSPRQKRTLAPGIRLKILTAVGLDSEIEDVTEFEALLGALLGPFEALLGRLDVPDPVEVDRLSETDDEALEALVVNAGEDAGVVP